MAFGSIAGWNHKTYCSNSPDEPLPRKGQNEQNLYIVGVAHSADFIHKCIGAVAGLSGDMAVVCAFSVSIGLVLIKPLARVLTLRQKRKYGCSTFAL